VEFGLSERVKEDDGRGVVEDDEPAIGGGANVRVGAKNVWDLDTVGVARREVIKGALVLRLRFGERKHEPWELWGEVARNLWN
jgi:hypothetical protein